VLTFKYTARNPATGQKITAAIDAESELSAAKIIREQGLAPLDISPAHDSSNNPIAKLKGRIKPKDKVLFSRQLSTLINAGLPLVQALRSVAEQTSSKPFKVVIAKVINDVEAGSTLSSAMAKHPQVFNDVYINLIAAGEASGTLDKALERLAIQQEKDAELISKIRGAMVYPIIVLCVMVVVVGFMIVKVIPQVQQLYKGISGAHLPFITVIMIDISQAIIKFWWLFIVLTVLAAFITSRWARTGPGKEVVDRLKMRMPPIGPLFMKVYMARFSRTGATLVASGVPLIQVLEITGRSINNVHIEDSLKKATDKVKGGMALSDALNGDPNFLELVPSMLKIGEQSGTIEQMLGKTADYYEREVDNEVKAISTVIEPILMVILGVVAFIIVAAVLLPIYSLAGQTIIK